VGEAVARQQLHANDGRELGIPNGVVDADGLSRQASLAAIGLLVDPRRLLIEQHSLAVGHTLRREHGLRHGLDGQQLGHAPLHQEGVRFPLTDLDLNGADVVGRRGAREHHGRERHAGQ
jgi:hypothetical protein